MTIEEIRSDGFEPDQCVDIELTDDSPVGICRSMGIAISSYGKFFVQYQLISVARPQRPTAKLSANTANRENLNNFSAPGGLFFITFVRKVMKIKNKIIL